MCAALIDSIAPAHLDNRVALVFVALLDKNEQADEPLGETFKRARVDQSDCEPAIEIRQLTKESFYIVEGIFDDFDADFEEELVEHAEFIQEAFWENTAENWHNINSRVKHFNRLLGQQGGQRVITRAIVEQVLGTRLPK